MTVNSIFISGWEYNRLLYDDPITPRNSGIPAEVLWNGCAQFWLFENIYVTKEAYDGDYAAFPVLGWTTGEIFRKLVLSGLLKTVDIKQEAEKNAPLKTALLHAHQDLRNRFSPEYVEGLIRARTEDDLEIIKLKLLDPLLNHLNCVRNVSPSSLRAWKPDAGISRPSNIQNPILGALASRVKPWRIGASLCNRPGTGVDKNDVARQREIELTAQSPIISDLLMSRLSHEDYMYELEPKKDVYGPISRQLKADFLSEFDRLRYLRDQAAKYLWKDLHTEWLPRLELDSSYYPTFEKNLKRAMGTRFSRATQITSIAFGTLAGALVGGGTGKIAAALSGDPGVGVAMGAMIGTPVGKVVHDIVKGELDRRASKEHDEFKNLSLFFQKLSDVDMIAEP